MVCQYQETYRKSPPLSGDVEGLYWYRFLPHHMARAGLSKVPPAAQEIHAGVNQNGRIDDKSFFTMCRIIIFVLLGITQYKFIIAIISLSFPRSFIPSCFH